MGKTPAITGTIERASTDPLHYGDFVSFTTTVNGRISPKGRVYVRVIGTQFSKVIYQWSADPDFAFPLVQQDGLAALGLMFDPAVAADFTAALIYREDGGQTIIKTLDEVAFVVVSS